MENVIPIPSNKEGEGQIDWSGPPLVPNGIYDVGFVSYSTAYMFNKVPKLVLNFRILDFGEHNGKVLPRYYNVKRIKGRPRKNGDFKVGRRSDFVHEYATLFGLPRRLDRVSMTPFKSVIIKAKVEVVTSDYKQRQMPEALKYSKIAELREVVEI
jgi:hypothetical protein